MEEWSGCVAKNEISYLWLGKDLWARDDAIRKQYMNEGHWSFGEEARIAVASSLLNCQQIWGMNSTQSKHWNNLLPSAWPLLCWIEKLDIWK